MNIRKFLVYNNAVPITFGVLFMSSGIVFAANEEVREFVADSVFEAEETIVSVDNSYMANVNLDTYSPKASISGVTEDDELYYIAFTFTTIALVDSVWQDVAQQRTIKVDKDALEGYTDLGEYVTEQLRQLVVREDEFLKETQEKAKRQVTNKVVATAFSGLVGQFIDESTEEIPARVPAVSTPAAEDPTANNDPSQTPDTTNDEETNEGEQENLGPVITVLGSNPARIPIGVSYSDLGAVATSQEGVTLDLSIILSLNGEEVTAIDIETSTVADWSVGYLATDQEGNSGFAERIVIVFDPNAQEEEEEEEEDTATTTATTTETIEEEDTATTTATTTPPVEEEETTEETATTTEESSTEEATENATSTQEQPEETATTTEETDAATSTATTTESQ